MKPDDAGGFWSTLWGVVAKPRITFKKLVEDGSALKKGLLVWLLFFGLLAIFFVIFLDKGYPGSTLTTLPFGIEAIYSMSLWFPMTLVLVGALASMGFLTLTVRIMGKSVRYTSFLSRVCFSLTIPMMFTTFVFFLMILIILVFGQVSAEFIYNWFREDGPWVPILFQAVGLIWAAALLALAVKQSTNRGWLLSMLFGVTAISLLLAPSVLLIDQRPWRAEEPISTSIQYPYPLYPFEHDYHQSIVFKLKSRTGSGDVEYNVQETLDQIRMIHHLSRGMPIIVYLSGWQQGGFDRQYPDLTRPGEHLMRPGIGSTPLEALKWLIEEAKSYNASVSLHINLQKATADNDLYHQYEVEDLLCKGIFGQLLYTNAHSARYQTARINTKLEWESGLTQKRIDDLMAMLPELQEVGTIHIDNFRPFPSTGHGTSPEDSMPYLKLIMAYFRDNYGVDVSSESTFNRRPNNDNMYGFQPWALSFAGMSEYQMRVPAYLYSGARKYEDEVFGSGCDLMPLVVVKDLDAIKECLYTHIIPTYYLNRLIRLDYLPETNTAVFSDDVVVVVPPEEPQQQSNASRSIIRRSGDLIKDGTDVFVPALWRYEMEIIAYSLEGYAEQTWGFPPDWLQVTAVDIYEISTDGTTLLESAKPIQDNKITLSLAPNQAVAIIPAGVDVRDNPPIPPSGEVVYLGEDRDTRGSWIGTYGAESYVIVGGDESLPPYIDIRYIGGEESIWSYSSTDQRALQRAHQPEDRMIAQRSTPIHEIVEVMIDDDSAIDVALYFVDWDNQQRQMIIDAVCANTNHAIHTVILKDIEGGVYLRYRMKGRIQFRFTILGEDGNTFNGGDVTYSGVFFGAK
jgi:hypothetical protein